MTIAGTAAAAFGGARIEHSLEPIYASLGFGTWGPATSLATVVVIVAITELVVGELVPKSLGLRYADRYSFFVARPLRALSQFVRPHGVVA